MITQIEIDGFKSLLTDDKDVNVKDNKRFQKFCRNRCGIFSHSSRGITLFIVCREEALQANTISRAWKTNQFEAFVRSTLLPVLCPRADCYIANA
jgi:hypothetical protein